MLPPLEADARYHTAMESLRAKDEWSLWVQLDKCRISDKKTKKVYCFFFLFFSFKIHLLCSPDFLGRCLLRQYVFGYLVYQIKYQFSGIWLRLVREWQPESLCTLHSALLRFHTCLDSRHPFPHPPDSGSSGREPGDHFPGSIAQ